MIPNFTYVLFFELLVTVSLYSGILCLCAFFLYLCCLITFKNPQKLKPSKVIPFTLIGIGIFIFSIWLVGFSSKLFITERQAFLDYKEGNWIVKDLYIKDYRGPDYYSRLTLLETEEGDLTLYWRPFSIYQGEMYRITYLEKNKTVIDIEKLENSNR